MSSFIPKYKYFISTCLAGGNCCWDKSFSCGYEKIYDGSFTNKLKKGDGVTCALLLEKNRDK